LAREKKAPVRVEPPAEARHAVSGRTPRRTNDSAAGVAVESTRGVAAEPASGASQVGPKTKEQKRAEADRRNRAYRVTKERKTRLAAVDEELIKAQVRHAELVELMASPDLYADPAAFEAALAEYNALKARLPVLEEEWILLTEEIDRLAADAQ
jgi:ATP-binding cassette subfamily F protein 3